MFQEDGDRKDTKNSNNNEKYKALKNFLENYYQVQSQVAKYDKSQHKIIKSSSPKRIQRCRPQTSRPIVKRKGDDRQLEIVSKNIMRINEELEIKKNKADRILFDKFSYIVPVKNVR